MIDQAYFDSLVTHATSQLQGQEVLLATTHSESTDFARFNNAQVRQAGTIDQTTIALDLIEGKRHADARLRLSGEPETDAARVAATLQRLRELRAVVPEDPYLIYNTDPRSTSSVTQDALPDRDAAMASIVAGGADRDLVGIYTSGPIANGFANSLGQRNWHQTSTFNFDWTFYLHADKAVKNTYAGFEWDDEAFGRKVADSLIKLEALGRTPIDLDPDEYAAYLTPAALEEVMGLLGWGGFGAQARRTGQSPLMRLADGQESLHPSVRLSEDIAHGVAPNFQSQGFLRPGEVVLVDHGKLADSLVSPRSAVEFDLETNGAAAHESPAALSMAPGSLDEAAVLASLGTGLYVGNLWYTNYSDRSACRVTGMTRFATFWVEGGEIVAPVNVLRFDDTVFNLLGGELTGLTSNAEFLLGNSTYGERMGESMRLPGALVDGMRFTL